MKQKPASVWLPFGFAAALSAISLIVMAIGASVAGGSHGGLITLAAFLPMAFFFSAVSHRQTREHVAALEERVRQLETGQRHSEGA